jgi:hypothetical protein
MFDRTMAGCLDASDLPNLIRLHDLMEEFD